MTRIIVKGTNSLAGMLLVVGALNWGLIALARLDVLAAIAGVSFGELNVVSRILYALIGLSGVWTVLQAMSRQRAVSRHRVEAVGSGSVGTRSAA